MIKTMLLASAFSLALFVPTQAAVTALDSGLLLLSKEKTSNLIHEAKSNNSGSGNSGSGNSGGGDNDDSGNDGGGDDGTPDQGGGNDDDNDDDNGGGANNGGGSNDDVSGSGRKKPRIPGGSGCDDAGDTAEHAGCSPQ